MPQLAKQTETSLSEINIVPFVDVMLVLLIIFMITAPILQSGIDINVPATQTVKELTDQKLVVNIDKAQRLYLGDDPVNIHDLGDKIHAQMRKQKADSVYLRADRSVPWGTVATVVDTLRQSGIENINMVTKPLSEDASGQ